MMIEDIDNEDELYESLNEQSDLSDLISESSEDQYGEDSEDYITGGEEDEQDQEYESPEVQPLEY